MMVQYCYLLENLIIGLILKGRTHISVPIIFSPGVNIT